MYNPQYAMLLGNLPLSMLVCFLLQSCQTMQPGTLKRLLVLEINIRDYSEYLKILPLWVMLQTKATFFRFIMAL